MCFSHSLDYAFACIIMRIATIMIVVVVFFFKSSYKSVIGPEQTVRRKHPGFGPVFSWLLWWKCKASPGCDLNSAGRWS